MEENAQKQLSDWVRRGGKINSFFRHYVKNLRRRLRKPRIYYVDSITLTERKVKVLGVGNRCCRWSGRL